MEPDQLSWNDARLFVRSEPSRRARYRRLQSWYRQHRLAARHGFIVGRNGELRPVGNLLHTEEVVQRPALNFLEAGVEVYANVRVPDAHRLGASLDDRRLRHNMLGSMPLCFNIFGALRHDPDLPQFLSELFGLDVAHVWAVECEYAPDPVRHLRDRTAFDAFVAFTTSDGTRSFLAVETKYTEPFSPTEYLATAPYRTATNASGWFNSGACEALSSKKTNQLWRNAMLAASLAGTDSWDQGFVAVLHLEGDDGAVDALEGLGPWLTDASRVRDATFQGMISAAGIFPRLDEWRERFTERYLDLTPIGEQVNSYLPAASLERRYDFDAPASAIVHALSWHLVAELLAGWPGRFAVTQTYPGGGQYDCLTLTDLSVDSSLRQIDLNRNGSAFVWSKGENTWSWVWRGIWAELIADPNLPGAAVRIAQHANLPTTTAAPLRPEAVAARFIANVLSSPDAIAAAIECRQEWTDDPNADLSSLPWLIGVGIASARLDLRSATLIETSGEPRSLTTGGTAVDEEVARLLSAART
jgi:hypothetical protein